MEGGMEWENVPGGWNEDVDEDAAAIEGNPVAPRRRIHLWPYPRHDLTAPLHEVVENGTPQHVDVLARVARTYDDAFICPVFVFVHVQHISSVAGLGM